MFALILTLATSFAAPSDTAVADRASEVKATVRPHSLSWEPVERSKDLTLPVGVAMLTRPTIEVKSPGVWNVRD